jgi:hypothetical protein
MMRTTLPEKWVQYLLRKPENGMGYQRVDVTFDDGSSADDCLVFNAEVIELPDSQEGKGIAAIVLHEAAGSRP